MSNSGARAQLMDGKLMLITNVRDMTPAEVVHPSSTPIIGFRRFLRAGLNQINKLDA